MYRVSDDRIILDTFFENLFQKKALGKPQKNGPRKFLPPRLDDEFVRDIAFRTVTKKMVWH
jgi:hypothetical protein